MPWTIAKPNLPCVDYWPPCSLTPAHGAAYEAAERLGGITSVEFCADRATGRWICRYLAAMPHEWVLEMLGQLKHQHEAQQTRLEV